jgi:hypothetical protein
MDCLYLRQLAGFREHEEDPERAERGDMAAVHSSGRPSSIDAAAPRPRELFEMFELDRETRLPLDGPVKRVRFMRSIVRLGRRPVTGQRVI